jgi:hypothetical protein
VLQDTILPPLDMAAKSVGLFIATKSSKETSYLSQSS